MNFRNETDQILIRETEVLVKEERERLTVILHRFREIERRRLFSALGYPSLFTCLVKHFGYPEDQAGRRIAAMRVIKELPEVEEKVASGEITLTHLGIAQSLFNQEKKANAELSPEKKAEVIEKIAGKPVREAQRIALSFASSANWGASSRASLGAKMDANMDANTSANMRANTGANMPIKERIRVISPTHLELKLAITPETEHKISRLKGLLAHASPGISTAELIEKLCDLGLSEWSKSAAPRGRCVKPDSKANQRREVFRRANDACENCGSHHALEIDHIIPRAKGGSDEPENLRVLCRSCNQRAAIEIFGATQMEGFLN